MQIVKRRLEAGRFLSLAASALFLFFFLYSAPHLVHHAFDESQVNPCLVFAIAKGCHLKPNSAINLLITQITIEEIAFSFELWIPYLTPSPFSKRAPPLA